MKRREPSLFIIHYALSIILICLIAHTFFPCDYETLLIPCPLSLVPFLFYVFFLMAIKKKEFELHTQSFDREGKHLSFETGKMAVQADCSLKIQFADNVLLCSTVMEKSPRSDSDFLPLMIDFRESFSAAGRLG